MARYRKTPSAPGTVFARGKRFSSGEGQEPLLRGPGYGLPIFLPLLKIFFQAKALPILTPHYMEKLIALDQDKWMKMGIQFQPNGTLLIVMRDVDFFEAETAKNVTELKEKLKNELLGLADTMERIGAVTLEEIAAQQEEGEGAT